MKGKRKMGIVTVSDRAVMQIAVHTAKKYPGVAGMSEKSRAVDTARFVAGNSDVAGVYVTKTKSGVKLEMYIACNHGADTKSLSQGVADAVTNAFAGTGITIKDVIVHINDVR